MLKKVIVVLFLTAAILLLYSLLLPMVEIGISNVTAAQFRDSATDTLLAISATKSKLVLDSLCLVIWAVLIFFTFRTKAKK